MDEIGIGLLDFGDKAFKVPRKPQIVMAQVGDVFSTGTAQTLVVRSALRANPLRQVCPIES